MVHKSKRNQHFLDSTKDSPTKDSFALNCSEIRIIKKRLRFSRRNSNQCNASRQGYTHDHRTWSRTIEHHAFGCSSACKNPKWECNCIVGSWNWFYWVRPSLLLFGEEQQQTQCNPIIVKLLSNNSILISKYIIQWKTAFELELSIILRSLFHTISN